MVSQEFFGQLDQRVLNAFLKACDELTDILPEQEQQTLQETVRKLHKHWKVSISIGILFFHVFLNVHDMILNWPLQTFFLLWHTENICAPSVV